MNRILVIGTETMKLDETLAFAELCRWLADGRPAHEVMKCLADHDLGRMECFGRCARQAEMAEICGEVPSHGLSVMLEYCALSQKRRHARSALSGVCGGGVA